MSLMEKVACVLTIVAVLHMQESLGAVYKVGDSAGWTTIGKIDYKQWAATKSFQLGDIIIFQYNPQFHNVMRVTHSMYKTCDTSAPIATHTTGNDSITITTQGHHLFFCGVPGHCQAGQKVDINVPRALAFAPTPAPHDTPLVPASGLHGPSPTNAASFNQILSAFGSLGLLGFIIAFIVFID